MENEIKTAAALPKATAANNQFLRDVKMVFNGRIYSGALATVRARGEEAALAYVQQFINVPFSEIAARIAARRK